MVKFWCAFIGLLLMGTQASAEGVLREMIQKAERLRLSVSTSESLYPVPFNHVEFRTAEESVVLKFDYAVLGSSKEWFVNISAPKYKLGTELLEQTLLPKQPTRVQSYFLKQIEAALYDKRSLALEIQSEVGAIQGLRAFLSRQQHRSGEELAFFPPGGVKAPVLIGEGGEHNFLPLVVVEFPSFVSPVTFQYSVVSVPLSRGKFTGDLKWINTRKVEQELQRLEDRKLEVEIRPASAQIFRTQPRENLDKEVLQLEAASDNISVFASWFAPLWLALYPNAKSLRIKKSLKSSLSVPVDIEPYRGVSCGPFLSQK